MAHISGFARDQLLLLPEAIDDYDARLRDLAKVDYGNRRACRDCPICARCTNDVRSVSLLENEAALDRMAERLKARPEILNRRREVVEHPFGRIKQWMYQGAFLERAVCIWLYAYPAFFT